MKLVTFAVLSALLYVLFIASPVTGSDETRPTALYPKERLYEVAVRGDSNASAMEVYENALIKAAKKTAKKKHGWFQVVERDTQEITHQKTNDSPLIRRSVQSRYCDLLSCTYLVEDRSFTKPNFKASREDDARYNVILKYKMIDGPSNAASNVYAAAPFVKPQ